MAKRPKNRGSASALEQLISQFAQPLAFLRELVQNSLDASTELIEVEVDYDKEADSCYVRVKDTGVGMDRDTIDTRLTRLFSSTKENDFTKIGKFGIGFVSIFAIEPKLVVMETGRDGESWRILFKPDRSFERRELQAPVEGTSITVFTPKRRKDLASLQAECKETVVYWCKHSEVEILFNGKPINETFDLTDSPFQYRHIIEGTEAVVAPTTEEKAFHGYYNRGLTLLEGKGSPLPHVAFKLRSRYLEHTLSRDNILFDDHYEKALEQVKKAAYEAMPGKLFEEIARKNDPNLWRLARVILRFPTPLPKEAKTVPLFHSSKERLSLSQLPKLLYYAGEVDDFWRSVEATGVTILRAQAEDDSLKFLKDLDYDLIPVQNGFLHFERVLSMREEESELLQALAATDRTIGEVVLVKKLQAPKRWASRFSAFLAVDTQVSKDPSQPRLKGTQLAVFQDHPFWQKSLDLYRAQPELGVSLTFRKIALELELGTEFDGHLFARLLGSLKAKAEP